MAADVVTRDQLAASCEQHERALRWQYAGGALPADWEEELAATSTAAAPAALRRLTLLKHFIRSHQGAKQAHTAAPDPEGAKAAAAALLRREPVRVRLESGRVVRITSRSLAAMIELAAHQARLRLLDAEVTETARIYARLLDAARHDPAGRHRKRLRAVEAVHRRLYSEQLRHRERLYAHLATPSGAAARADEPAPEWWREVTPVDDARLLMAAYEAGPLRYGRLGAAPESKDRKERTGEDWGYEGLLSSWGVRRKVAPAEMMDADLAQALTEMRLSAPPSLEEEVADG
jgi:hypothetical protein